jgi:uncharacterized membrane protein YgcG
MKKLIAALALAAAILTGCSSQPSHTAAHKSPACRVLQDSSGHAYCAVATPAHTGANTTDSSQWLWYMLYMNSANQPASPSSIGAGSTWRPMAPGYTPPSLSKTDVAVSVDPKSSQPGEEPENAEQLQDAVVEDPEENANPEAEVNEVGPENEAPADGPGSDGAGTTDSGTTDSGGSVSDSGGGDAGGGGGGE